MKRTTTPGITRLIFFLFVITCSFTNGRAYGQLVYNETFGAPGPYPSLSLPFGWSQGKWGPGSDADNYFDRVNVGAAPVIAARSGPAMLRYHSSIVPDGEASFVASKQFDMRAMPAGGANFTFWMYRDNGAAADNDRIEVYVNTAPNPTGATLLLENTVFTTVINRNITLPPAVAVAGWYQYSYNIPSGAPDFFNTSASVYVVIVATASDGNDIHIDDFSITSYPLAQTFVSAGAVSPNTATTSKGATNQQIIGCRITTSGALAPLSLTNMQFNTNGTTNATTDIDNAKLWFTGGTNTFDATTATQLPPTFINPHATNYSFAGAWSILEHGDNYFWITYDIDINATSGNVVDAEWLGFNLNLVPQVPNPQILPGNREIDVDYCVPTYLIGTAWNNYTTNDYIRSVILTGDNIPPPGINNTQNWINTPAGPSCPPPVPRNCPFQSHPPDYEFFAAVAGKTTSLTADGTTVYPISLGVGTFGFGNSIAAWIDYNKDGIFQAVERIAQSPFPGLGANGNYNTTFTVPVTAIAGKTRMRVREVWIDWNISPCDFEIFGETEDYTVTIVPDCPSATGYTTWLGFTDDWTDPSNWCPPVPPIPPYPLANVRIPGGPSSAGYTYIRPVIRSNVTAQTLKLRVEQNDTIFIDAPSASSLTVSDSLKIEGNASAIIVNSEKAALAKLLNGNLTQPTVNANNSPMANQMKVKSFMAFEQSELLGQGLIAGDVINEIQVVVERRSTNPVYSNVTMTYYYSNFSGVVAGVAPNVFGPNPVTIYTNPSLSVATIPANTTDTIKLPLLTPIVWNGGVNKLIITLSYDNTGSGLTGINEQPRYTQTTGFRHYLVLAATPLGNTHAFYPSNNFLPQATVMVTSATAASNIVFVTSTANIAQGMLITGGGFPANTYVALVVNGTTIQTSAPASANIVNQNRTFGQGQLFQLSSQQDYRPNLIFKYNRPYIKYPIAVAGHWENNGTFSPGISRVTFNGTTQQQIQGTDSTTFYDLTINNNNHVILIADAGVTDSLYLQNGRFKLNSRLLTVTNPSPSAIVALNGLIQSEQDVLANNVAPFGRLRWTMGTVAGIRTLPWGNTANAALPMDYEVLSGDHDVTFATYATQPTNLNLPAPVVTNIFGFNGTTWNSDGSAMVDRFYMIDNPDVASSATIAFRYPVTERSQTNLGGAATMRAQRWITSSGLWEFPFLPGQLYAALAPDRVRVPSFNDFGANIWWAIVGDATPLPVSLIDFAATQQKDKVKLHWTTASEINNSHFEIERTTDHKDFEFIGRVNSKGSGTNVHEYVTWDLNPLEGTQYYMLRQYDYDGKMESYGPVAATFRSDLFDIITTTIISFEQGVTVAFNYDSEEPFSYKITDVTGRVIVEKANNNAVKGVNVIDIPAHLSKGVYSIMLQNSSKTVARKFFY